ncbi:hypothetical protein MUP77_23675 [Candidatus Bathyarchaeota archaeon]|nr:hypothetical protein [Candidatus Bathyarchaeota archaeon]
MNIVILSTMPWGFLWQRPHQIAVRLANKGNNVAYFNSRIDLSPSTLVRLFKEKNFFMMRKITENLRVVNLFVLPFHGKLKAVTERLCSLTFKMYLKFLKSKPDVVVFYHPRDVFLLGALKSMGVKILYDCVDEYSAFPGVSDASEVQDAERKLVAESSIVLAISRTLCKKISKVNPKCFYVPNAADFEHFNSAMHIREKPQEIRGLKRPTVGFIGAIWDWINIDVICRLAELHPDYSILLVGPVYFGLDKLERYSNIFIVGHKKYELLPQYLSCIDVCLIPFKLNELT